MNIIVTVDKNWGLSWKKHPLVQIPADYRFTQAETRGKVTVMTEEMMASFPGGKPMGGRRNLILAKSADFHEPGAMAFSKMQELKEGLSEYRKEDIFILGGQPLFDELLGECRQIHLTWVNFSYQADCWFPNLAQRPEWKLAERTGEQTYYDLEYYFLRFIRAS